MPELTEEIKQLTREHFADNCAGEQVNHPNHYNAGGIECIEAIRAALTEEEFRGFCKGNAIKYLWREKHKNGIVDLQKANWYIKEIERGNEE